MLEQFIVSRRWLLLKNVERLSWADLLGTLAAVTGVALLIA